MTNNTKWAFAFTIWVVCTVSVQGKPTGDEEKVEKILKKVDLDLKEVQEKIVHIEKDEVKITQTNGRQPSSIPEALSSTFEEIKEVEKELKEVVSDLTGINVDFSKTDELLIQGEKAKEDIAPQHAEVKHHDRENEGLLAFHLVDKIMNNVSGQMKSVFQCFQNYMQCLKETDHQIVSCNNKLRSDVSCQTGHVNPD